MLNIIKSKDLIYNIDNNVPIKIEPTEKNVSYLNNKIWYIINNEPNLNNQITNNHFHSINKD